MNVAIIPARGGSKRIPRKNIQPFFGKPMIGYAIDVAVATRLFDRIIVSTDDDEIAAVAEGLGAEVPFRRPAELANDFAGTTVVIKHAIQWLNDHGPSVQYACCIYSTVPFLQPEYLQEGYEKLLASGSAYTFPITSFPAPIQRAVRVNAAGCIESFYPENFHTRSQDLEPAYYDAGQFYWGRAEAFLEEVIIHAPTSLPVYLPRHMVQDIDTLEDWQHAERMYADWKASGMQR
ncbi:MAG: pseudaminic acid cytidylyltransferase [Magnetococcales bacterium]|nr:pseudaminic acid cytidylyltransferase [Magnetococcales bacterium]